MSDFTEYYANEKDALEYRIKITLFTLAQLIETTNKKPS